MRVAAISHSLTRRKHDWARRLARALQRASWEGADLAVIPELTILDALAGDLPPTQQGVPPVLAALAGDYVSFLTASARSLGITLVGGSHVEETPAGFRNVCAVAFPDGELERVEKRMLTQWEANEWGLVPGEPTDTPRLDAAGIGVAICYDAEFPELVRPIARRGVKLLCVPSFTETRHGFQRVRWCAAARAIENQIYVAHSTLTGSLGGEPVPSTYGSSALLSPSIPPYPETAVLAETAMNRAGVVVADLDFGALDKARVAGDVRNWADYLEGLEG